MEVFMKENVIQESETCLEKQPLNDEMLERMNEWWRAANYLGACQLYLLDNPLLKRPLKPEDIKKKIVGHWGTVPGQNFVFTHLNRVIKRYDLDMILLSGAGTWRKLLYCQ
jgi:xylulose-5-phosphate/fructose-6-phosphate phosphoketolase